MPLSAVLARSTTPVQPGVYRRAPKSGDPAMWYEVTASQRIVALQVVQPGDDEAEIAVRMWDAFRGRQKPKLELVRNGHVSPPRRFVLSPNALRGLFRRSSSAPARPPLR